MTYVRYDCPVDGCGWHHDGDWANMPPRLLVRQELSPGETLDLVLTQAAREAAAAVDAVLREHLESHDVVDWLRTVQRLRMELGQYESDIQPHTVP